MKKNLEEMQVKVANKRAILESHDGEEFSPITVAKNVLCEDGTTMQDYFDSHSEPNISTKIVNSNSMSKVGQGDNVDFSDNVMNGAYDEMVLKGKSLVNVIQGSSKDKVVLPYSFEEGERVTINDTHSNGRVEVEVKGRTLVNLVPTRAIDYIATSDYDGVNFLGQHSNGGGHSWKVTYDLKPNTKYYISCYVETFDVTEGQYYLLNDPASSSVFSESMRVESTGFYKWLSTTKSELTDEIFMALRCQNALARGAIKIKNIMIIEYQEGMENWDIPYFEGMQSVKMPILHTVGKNLIDYKNYNLKANAGQNPQEIIIGENQLSFNVNEASWVSLWYDLYLESGENYKLSYDTDLLKCFIFKSKVNTYTNSELIAFATVIDATEDKIQKVEKTFTAPSTGFIRIRLTSEQKMGNHTLQNFQIEKGTTATTYEAHKSSILSLPEEVILRSLPNGVCDTYNTKTKEYTQRIGEVVLDGTQSVSMDGSLAYIYIADLVENNVSISDTLPSVNIRDILEGVEGVAVQNRGGGSRVYININGLITSEEITQRLQQKPTTVQYALTTPIITKVDLPSLKAYNTITHLSSTVGEGSLIPILASDNTISYPVVIKPSTQYSIIAHKDCNYHTTNLNYTFDLGGATTTCPVNDTITTVTTPSTLSHQELRVKGQGLAISSVRVIEGEVAQDLPYFEGICDVKSPIVKNVGKNLFSIDGEWVHSTYEFNTVSQGKHNQIYTKIGANEFKIETGSRYENGFGQYIDVQGLEEVRIKATFNDLDTKTPSRIMGVRLNKDEPLDEMITNGNHEHYRRGNFAMQAKDGVVDMVVPTNGYSTLFVNFSASWKNNESGSHIFTVKDVYVGANEDYEPYKSNTTTFTSNDDESIVLRSLPNGICDTLNVKTGEYVQKLNTTRLTSNVITGGQTWYALCNGQRNQYKFNIDLPADIANAKKTSTPLCNKFAINNVWSEGNYGYDYISTANNSLFFVIDIDSLPQLEANNHGVNRLKKYLDMEEVYLTYELATPIVKQVNVEGYPYAYENGHVLLESGSQEQSLTPTIEYSIVANRGGQIRSNQRMVERHQKKLDSLYAMTLVNMIDSQYKQVLMKLKSELGSEVRTWDIE